MRERRVEADWVSGWRSPRAPAARAPGRRSLRRPGPAAHSMRAEHKCSASQTTRRDASNRQQNQQQPQGEKQRTRERRPPQPRGRSRRPPTRRRKHCVFVAQVLSQLGSSARTWLSDVYTMLSDVYTHHNQGACCCFRLRVGGRRLRAREVGGIFFLLFVAFIPAWLLLTRCFKTRVKSPGAWSNGSLVEGRDV